LTVATEPTDALMRAELSVESVAPLFTLTGPVPIVTALPARLTKPSSIVIPLAVWPEPMVTV
jgi:hypothetical protein